MELHKINMITDFILLIAVIGLFVYIKWYFSTLSSNIRNRLQPHEIVLAVFMGLIVFFVVVNDDLTLFTRYAFFIVTTAIHIGSCWYVLKTYKRKPIFSKSYLIFHNGKFYKGNISQNRLTEDDILRTLKLKGVEDLKEVDTIILEADGELSVIFKNKVESAV